MAFFLNPESILWVLNSKQSGNIVLSSFRQHSFLILNEYGCFFGKHCSLSTFKLYLVALRSCFCTMDLPDHDIHKYLIYALYYLHLNVVYTLLFCGKSFYLSAFSPYGRSCCWCYLYFHLVFLFLISFIELKLTWYA